MAARTQQAPKSPTQLVNHLKRLTELADASGEELGPFVAEHAETLAPFLEGLSPLDLHLLSDCPDDDVARELHEPLQCYDYYRSATRRIEDCNMAQSAALEFAQNIRWSHGDAHFNIRTLFGNLIEDETTKFIRFWGRDIDVTIARTMLIKIRGVYQKIYPKMNAFFRESTLHFRWNDGRGQFNLLSQTGLKSKAPVLTVCLIPSSSDVTAHSEDFERAAASA